MDEFMCSDVVRGRISGVDDCRAKSAGASMFKWFIGHLVEAHFALFCSYKHKDEQRTIVAGGHVLDSEQVLWSDERCFNAEQGMERLLAVHMVLVVHVKGLCAGLQRDFIAETNCIAACFLRTFAKHKKKHQKS